MGKNQVQEIDRFKNYPWIAGKYYDHPDGEDLLGKLKFTTKIGATAGSFIGLLHALTPETNTFSVKCIRFLRCFFPCVGMAASFTIVTFYSTVLRKKDDELNYLLGGVAAGSILGAVTGRSATGVLGAIICGIVGISKKRHQLTNEKILITSDIPRQLPPYYVKNWDFSLEPKRKGNWTKE